MYLLNIGKKAHLRFEYKQGWRKGLRGVAAAAAAVT